VQCPEEISGFNELREKRGDLFPHEFFSKGCYHHDGIMYMDAADLPQAATVPDHPRSSVATWPSQKKKQIPIYFTKIPTETSFTTHTMD
jgi:hypothetical protein